MKPQLFNFHGQPTLDSREVAKMIGKRHKNLMRDIRQYINDLDEGSKLSSPKFFKVEPLSNRIVERLYVQQLKEDIAINGKKYQQAFNEFF